MNLRTWAWNVLIAAAAAAPVAAAPAEAPPPGLALLPETAIAFFHVPSLAGLERDLKHFADRTGWKIAAGERPVLDILVARTGLAEGLDPAGSVSIGFMDPKRFRDRYTVYVLPVADWDALLGAAKGELMSPGLYALTGTAGPRFVARRGNFAVVTSSIRTMDALADGRRLTETLSAETLRRAAAGAPLVHVNVHALKAVYETDIATWFRASTAQMYDQPHSVAYADMLITYMLGIASFIDQMETLEAGLHLGPEGLSVDLAAQFVKGASVAEFLSAQTPAVLPVPVLSGRPVASAATLRVSPEKRADFALRATQFFLELAPRPEPLPESTKQAVYAAVREFVASLGDTMTFLSAPAAPGQGLESDVAVYDLADPPRFRKSVDLLTAAWERLADQLDLYLKFKALPDTTEVAGVEVMTIAPRLRFGIPARHVEFRKRLQALYGPEGLVYRVAVVGNRAVVSTGTDQTLLRKVIEQLQAGAEPAPSPALQRLATHVPRDQNVLIVVSLPVYLGRSLVRGGTPEERVGVIDPGHEVVGVGVRFDGAAVRLTTYWPHEQLRLARELLDRAAPEFREAPESLFRPTPEGPPAPPAAPPAVPPGPPAAPPAP